jgi:hypothetical protein
VAQVEECLPSKCEALNPKPTTTKKKRRKKSKYNIPIHQMKLNYVQEITKQGNGEFYKILNKRLQINTKLLKKFN